MCESLGLSFSEIPNIPPILLDYISHFEKLQSFFPRSFSSDKFRSTEIVSPPPRPLNRGSLVDVLQRQNRLLGAGPKTFENLERLAKNHCCAVVTGQQVGLFTGPAYTIYKALTAVKLADAYTKQGVEAVPVFWMATEDHDIDEVKNTQLVVTDSTPKKICYEGRPEDYGRSVSDVLFTDSIGSTLNEFLKGLPDSDFKPELANRLTQAYCSGKSYGQAFGEVLSFLFSDYGLILLDPQDQTLKNLAKPFFLRIVDRWTELQNGLRSRNAQLVKVGYPLQVPSTEETTFLFMEEEGKRRGVVRVRDQFHLRGVPKVLTPSELRVIIEQRPERISPNVLMRPLVQDFLLPTIAYVAGPSELGYFAQLSNLYQTLGEEMPRIFPRASFTVIEKRMEKFLMNYRLCFQDLFQGSQALLKLVIEQSVNQEVSLKFDQLQSNFSQQLGEMAEPLKLIDPTLSGALNTTQQKVQYQLGNLRAKFVGAASRRQEIVQRQIESVYTVLYPSKELQERQLNIFYFLSRYGCDFLARLYGVIDLSCRDHKLFYLSKF